MLKDEATDCGIGSRVGYAEVALAKPRALAEGAGIASRQLWERWVHAQRSGQEPARFHAFRPAQ